MMTNEGFLLDFRKGRFGLHEMFRKKVILENGKNQLPFWMA